MRLTRALILALIAPTLALAACGSEPSGGPGGAGPGVSTPSFTPTPSPTLPDLDRGCAQISALAIMGGLDLPYSVAAGVPALLGATAWEDIPLLWIACGPDGARLEVEGEAWVSLTLPVAGDWDIAAFEGPNGVGAARLTALPGAAATARFDRGQVGATSQGHDLGALPWPSDLYREPGTGRITLTETSLFDRVPDALKGIAPLMVNGLRKGIESLDAFPISASILVTTDVTAPTEAFEALSGPEAFTALGAPAFLIEVGDDDTLASGRRIPLLWRYAGIEGLKGDRIRNSLSLFLPPGQILREGREYLFVVTTRAGGDRGPWAAAAGFTRFLSEVEAGEPEGAPLLRARLAEAVATYPDLPSLDVVVSAGRFETRDFSHQLEAVSSCLYSGACEGVPGLDPPPAPGARFPTGRWVYWDTPPVTGPPAEEGHRSIAQLTQEAGLVFPSDAYRLIAFGTYKSPILQGVDPNLVGDGPIDPAEQNPAIKDVFVEDGDGLKVFGLRDLRFALILPKGEPPPGGFPVMIFIHGLSRDMLDAFLAAEILAPEGVAILAIDQVAHGSRFDFGPIANADVINNFSALEYGAEEGAGAEEQPWEDTGDGVSDARVSPGYETISILNFFEWLGNFRGMGDNFRQLAVDIMQLETVVMGAGAPGGLNSQLRAWGLPPLSTAPPMTYGRSLGAIALGVFLPYAPGDRTSILGVPGGGIATHIAANSPFVGNLITQAAQIALDCASQGVCSDPGELEDIVQESPEATEFLAVGDPFTHLIQGLVEPGDPLSLASRLDPAKRGSQMNLLIQYACADEILPNPAALELIRRIGAPSLTDVDLPGDIPTIPSSQTFPFPTQYGDAPPEWGPDRPAIASNRGTSTQGALAYCPGTHMGIYDRLEIRDEVYAFYPDGPFPGGTQIVFPSLPEAVPVENHYRSARETLVNFTRTALEGAPVITAPAVEQVWDMDDDGVPNGLDPCPYGDANPLDPEGKGACR